LRLGGENVPRVRVVRIEWRLYRARRERRGDWAHVSV